MFQFSSSSLVHVLIKIILWGVNNFATRTAIPPTTAAEGAKRVRKARWLALRPGRARRGSVATLEGSFERL